MKVTKQRSAVKALSWRFFATIITFVVIWAVTGKGTLAFSIASLESIIKTVAYYWHERIWDKTNWGRNASV
jgi:uncharacterized membrane protein